MLSFLKAPANAPLITDKHEVDARYRYWRRHILITIWLGYALFYFTRKSFNAAAPEILASGILTRSDIGLLAAARPSAGDWFTAGRRLAARCAGGSPTARGRRAKPQRNPR